MKKSKYDIILLDVNMPGMTGVDCVKKIRQLEIETKILILTQFDDQKLIDRLMKFGIDGYLLKNSTKEKLIDAIRKVHQGVKYFSEEIKPSTSVRRKRASRYDFFKCNFSKREDQILHHICEGKTNSDIAEELGLSVHSIETFRVRVMNKSGMHNVAELVRWAIENDIL